ncbi:inositol monophosphatase family protein [Haloechinothrix aidingensis]|uniref:inositol monophosphatase family protein n=1 Tax=Haloechinothrix aidingensis TaxID=2752311 RepID=UPI0031B5964E
MTTDYPALTEVAARVASEAAELVRAARLDMTAGRTVDVATKSSQTDLVTAVDRESEACIRDRLARLRPGEPMLGEEDTGTGVREADAAAGSEDGVTWVVDPIDGTVNFLYGYPAFAVSVAARVGGESVAGAVVEPVSGRCWTAGKGHGAWLGDTPLRVSDPKRIELTLLATGFAYDARRRARQGELAGAVLGSVRDIRRSGSAALDLCAVAAGWVDAYYEHGLSPWDWAAGALIAREAGALVSPPGADTALGADATLAASPSIADGLRELLVSCGAGRV